MIRDALARWPDIAPIDPETAARDAAQMASIVCAPVYRSLLRQHPDELLARVRCPVLALFGGKDVQVPGAANREAFERATAHHPAAEARLFDDLNHLFQVAQTGSIAEYEALAPGPAPHVLDAIADWLEALG